MKTCSTCAVSKQDTEFYRRGGKRAKELTSECKECSKHRMGERHQHNKTLLVNEFGGECQNCGYKKDPRILVFHHRDPKKKLFTIAQKLSTKLSVLREEAAKCTLLCPNCHREYHLGLWGELRETRAKTKRPEVLSYVCTHCRNTGPKLCLDCDTEITRWSTWCKPCSVIHRRTKITWPTTENLLKELSVSNLAKLGRSYLTSGNTVKKRLKNHPPKSPIGLCFTCAKAVPEGDCFCVKHS